MEQLNVDLGKFAPKQEAKPAEPQLNQMVKEVIEENAAANQGSKVDSGVEEIASKAGISTEKMDEKMQESIKKLILKIDGEEIEEDLPFSVTAEQAEYLKKNLQLAKVSQKRMQETAELKKNFLDFINEFKNAPDEVMADLGIDPEAFAESLIEKRIQQLQKSPEQVAQENKDKELASLRKRLEQVENEKKQSKLEIERQQAKNEVSNEIDAALKADGRLPVDDDMRQDVANLWYQYLASGEASHITAKDVVNQVYKNKMAQIQKMTEILPDKVLEEFIGKKAIDKLRKNRLESPVAPPTVSNIKDVKQPVDVKKVAKKIDLNSWLRNRDRSLTDMLKD